MRCVVAVRKRTIKHGTNHFGIPSRVEGKHTNGTASFNTTDYISFHVKFLMEICRLPIEVRQIYVLAIRKFDDY